MFDSLDGECNMFLCPNSAQRIFALNVLDSPAGLHRSNEFPVVVNRNESPPVFRRDEDGEHVTFSSTLPCVINYVHGLVAWVRLGVEKISESQAFVPLGQEVLGHQTVGCLKQKLRWLVLSEQGGRA